MNDKLFYTILGIVGTILLNLVLNVIGNLVTPDRKRIADLIRDWWARSSQKRAKQRIQVLKGDLEEVNHFAENPNLLSMYLWQSMFAVIGLLCVVGASFLVLNNPGWIGFWYTFFSTIVRSVVISVFYAVAAMVLMGVFIRSRKYVDFIDRVHHYDSYRTAVEQQIAELQEEVKGPLDVSGVWKGVFHDGQSGVLNIEQDGNSLQAVLTTDCLHLGRDDVYQEKLSGTISGKQVALAGESVSIVKGGEVCYELDRFDLTLSSDEKSLTGTASDAQGKHGAEFHRDT
ncbi:MAG: hypothetical protein H8D43_03110 [Chloroflexi bacterium]|nr:hypothetical protein [Chloroflexota bacterium]